MDDIKIGSCVRVKIHADESQKRKKYEHRRGIIAFISYDKNDGLPSAAEVILDNEPIFLRPKFGNFEADSNKSEEIVAKWKDIQRLVSFELKAQLVANDSKNLCTYHDQPSNQIVDRVLHKSRKLSAIRDFRAARQLLCDAAQALTLRGKNTGSTETISVGSNAIIYSGKITDSGVPEPTLGPGIISYTEDDRAEIEIEGNDINVSQKNLVPVPADVKTAVEYVSLLNELTKLALQQEPPDTLHALESGNVSAHICMMLLSDAEEYFEASSGYTIPEDFVTSVETKRFAALMLLSRAYILSSSFKAAAAFLKQAVMLRPNDRQARELVRLVKSRYRFECKQNKILATNVAKWVDTAMRQNAERQDQETPEPVGKLNENACVSASSSTPQRSEGQGFITWVKGLFGSEVTSDKHDLRDSN